MARIRTRFVAFTLGGTSLMTAPLAALAQDQVPVLNVDATCRGTETTAAGFGRGPEVCRRTELERARPTGQAMVGLSARGS